MRVIYRPWVSPYSDDDFDWDPTKSLRTFEDSDFVFEAARIVFRGPLIRRQDTRRRRSAEPRFMVLGELYGRVIVVIYTPPGQEMPHHIHAPSEFRGEPHLL
jgi:uncharacterized DUF497 family protein